MFYCIDHRQSGQLYLKFKKALHSTPEDKSMQCPAAPTMLLCDKIYTHTHTIYFVPIQAEFIVFA